jgi:hypothetical protein
MQDYEKLGVFYLGRHYDLKEKKAKADLLLYESKHLVTHGLVVGMTGSGKTGLCFDIIEEAAIDGIPAILIDPKGDLANLLLTFPALRSEDFIPWVNEDDARKQGVSVADLAAQQAELWRKGLAAWDQDGARTLTLYKSPALGQTSKPGEEERDFRIRLQQSAHEQRDAAAEKLRQKYALKIAALQERLRRAGAAKEREAEQAKRAKLDTVISLGSTLLGAFLGRKAISIGTVGKAATTMRGVGRAMDQSGDVARAGETVEAIQQQLTDLDAQFRSETDALAGAIDPSTASLESIELRPNKTNINVRLVALVWLPFTRDAAGLVNPAY